MHDIRLVRDDPARFDAAMARRGLEPQAAALVALDERRRSLQTEAQSLQSRRNDASKRIGLLKRTGEDASALIEEVARIKARLPELEDEEREASAALAAALAGLPNLPDAEVPDGADEEDNRERHRVGEPDRSNAAPEHFEIGEALGLMDFETAARLSGSRFVILRGALARLERALGQFMLDLHVAEHGYVEIQPPLLVRDHVLFGTGQLPKFADQQFRTTGDHWLIPTAEVPLTNTVADEILEDEALPLRMTALTPCFRSEAGAAGRDTRGMIRQHQFNKVELVSITRPEASAGEHERMLACAETVLRRLELPYRVVSLCTGDLGFAARKTYDIEVWLPGQQRYREISSCSNCGDFQARRMNSRCRPRGEKKTRFVHTLNGSGVAVGRALIAVMETYRQQDGGIAIPSVLRPYMGNPSAIAPDGTLG